MDVRAEIDNDHTVFAHANISGDEKTLKITQVFKDGAMLGLDEATDDEFVLAPSDVMAFTSEA